MGKRHVAELLVEANKKLSQLIDKMDDESTKDQMVIDEVNEVIRELDGIVEGMEK